MVTKFYRNDWKCFELKVPHFSQIFSKKLQTLRASNFYMNILLKVELEAKCLEIRWFKHQKDILTSTECHRSYGVTGPNG